MTLENSIKKSAFKVQIDKDLEDLIPGFLENRRAETPVLIQALKDSNFETLKSIGHKTKGNAGGYGFDELGKLGAQLEIAAPTKNKEVIQEILTQMQSYLEHVEVEYVSV
jgi:HPt (histidine-containing phosphotransfer) domain-containing protein